MRISTIRSYAPDMVQPSRTSINCDKAQIKYVTATECSNTAVLTGIDVVSSINNLYGEEDPIPE